MMDSYAFLMLWNHSMSIIHAFRTQVGWISVPDSAGFALKIPFLQLDHARKSDSVAQNPSDFFVRLSMCLELNALRSGCSEESPLGTHLDFYSKVHSYELFVGNVIISEVSSCKFQKYKNVPSCNLLNISKSA